MRYLRRQYARRIRGRLDARPINRRLPGAARIQHRRMRSRQPDEKSVQVQVAGRARVYAERELFRRAVSNLLANALDRKSVV